MTLRGLIVSFIMTIVLSIMVLGYAALQQRIDIQGEATVDSTYRVEITRVQEGTVTGNARSTSAPQYNGLNASFYVGLTNTTDYITYNIEITNYSTVDIKLNELSITVDGSNYIKAPKLGISNGDIMLAGSTKNITLKVKYNGEAQSSEQTGTVTLNFNFTRLKGGVGQVVPEVYDAYSIGDKVTFAGSDWYVIEDSGINQDYVTVLKDYILMPEELTVNYAYNSGKTMPYYWSDTCHRVATYGTVIYSSYDESGCRGHTNYVESKVKEFLDSTYIVTLGETNLKEVNGYKIRLITQDELINQLGWASGLNTSATTEGNDVPAFIYSNYGATGSSYGYWTMTSNSTTHIVLISRNGEIATAHLNQYYYSIRPVINLYKDAIE